eukprot:7216330-Pyramimonas_sp.AAC.1
MQVPPSNSQHANLLIGSESTRSSRVSDQVLVLIVDGGKPVQVMGPPLAGPIGCMLGGCGHGRRNRAPDRPFEARKRLLR